MRTLAACARLSNRDLRNDLHAAAATERGATADLIALIAEFDLRRLYFEDGFNSTFSYCVKQLHLAESSAYARIQAARAARKWPSLLDGLADGSLTLTNVVMLAPHLRGDDGLRILKEARHKSKAEVERLVARLNPQPDVPSVVRKLPAPAPTVVAAGVESAAPATLDLESPSEMAAPVLSAAPPPKPAVIAALAPERYKIQITVDQETRDLLRQAQDLMRHALPSGDPATVISRALKVLVADLLRRKAAIGAKPRRSAGVAEGSRDIPAAVMREVWDRDQGRCAHVGPKGRCNDAGFVEFHHVIPYAMGGRPTAGNIELRCRAHNAHQAELDGLGRRTEEEKRAEGVMRNARG